MMTEDQALARIMELHKMPPDEKTMRAEVRMVLSAVRQAGYSEGSDDQRYGGWADDAG